MPLDEGVRRRLAPFVALDWTEFFNDPSVAAAYDEAFAGADGYEPPDVRVSDESVDGPAGAFRVRVYRPAGPASSARPCLVWAHGGGFVGGSIDMREADMVSREVCARAEAVVVSVDYHLAGDHFAYPTLHREVMSALDWARQQAARLDADPARITLGGASAGANLAVAATLELRDRGERLPSALALAYPPVHRRLEPLPHIAEGLVELPVTLRFDQQTVDSLFDAYLAGAADARYATADGHDLAGLPRSLVIVCEYDTLRPSGERFASEARSAGVDVELHLAAGMPHGHLNMTPHVDETDRSLDRIARFVATAGDAG